jgi:hypothetical protein
MHPRFITSLVVILVSLLGTTPTAAAQERLAPGPLEILVQDVVARSPIDRAIVQVGGRYTVTNDAGLATLDGVPAGNYDVVITRHGFDRHELKIALAAGPRERIAVSLDRTVRIGIEGSVALPNGRPVAGARIDLKSTNLPVGGSASCHVVTTWDGTFSIMELPIGTYDVTVAAHGCMPFDSQITIDESPGPFQFEMAPVTGSTTARIQVLDAVTDAPIANAHVTLAEAWPLGVFASQSTGGDGAARFDHLPTAQLNWLQDDSSVAATSGRATVHVEAEGYEPRSVPVPFQLPGDLTVTLNPTELIEESEPNNDLASAQDIRFGAPVRFAIPENGDNEFFRFRLEHPARVHCVIGPDNPLWLWVGVLGSDGRRLAYHQSDVGAETVFDVDLDPGEYFIHVHQYYNSMSSQQPMTLTLTRQTIADAFEPNDRMSMARRIEIGEEARGCIFPLGDHDHFAFELTRPSAVRLTMPPVDLWRLVAVYDMAGNRLAHAAADKDGPFELRKELPPGRYIIRVKQYYDNAVSLNPYSIRLEVIEDDHVDDPPHTPPSRLRSVRPLELGDTIGSTIHPVGDIDRYRMNLPTAGVLHAKMTTPIWCRLRLLATDGTRLADAHADIGRECEISWHCNHPTSVILEVHSYYNHQSLHLPYILENWWEPADEHDALWRNEGPDDAVPWLIPEPLRGSILPLGDNDTYELDVDHPGYLHLEGTSPVWTRIILTDTDDRKVADVHANPGERLAFSAPVLPGRYALRLYSYYNNQASVTPYDIDLRLERAESIESPTLKDDPPRLLRLGQAQPFKIEHRGDLDRFVFDIPDPGPFHIHLRPTVWTRMRVFDETTGDRILDVHTDPNTELSRQLETDHAARFRIELRHYYDSDASMDPGWIVVDRTERPLVGADVVAEIDETDPTHVTFRLQPIEGFAAPEKASVDADGDGAADVRLTPGEEASFRYEAEGNYEALAWLRGADGTDSIARTWVEAVGPTAREGIQVIVRDPAEGAVIASDEPCRVRALSYTGAPISRVDFALDGRIVATRHSEPFEVDLPWRRLTSGKHTLTVTAHDRAGEQGAVERTVSRSEYFGLRPTDGSVVTGDDVVVQWVGTTFGRAAVRYRPVDTDAWTTVEGERSQDRRIVLRDLEHDQQYEFQPLGGDEPGPVRIVKRVRGLAFGRDRYAATIERDYDQRLGVSVRNNGDEPLRLKLECGTPPEESQLLVGFVGEGSEGAPVDLAPGEERDFMLVLSAQDVNTPKVSFPIRISSDTGSVDEAEVSVDVNLPEVNLRFEEVASASSDLRRVFTLHNDGDGLTDLALRTDSADIHVSPMIDHGIFPRGDRLRIVVTPRLYEGFSSASGAIVASAVGEDVAQDVALSLPEGQSVYGMQLVAGAGIVDDSASIDEHLMAARAMAGAFLNPDSIDWSAWSDPSDTNDDGRPDRWAINDEVEGILWVGDDTDEDGEIDFVHADIGDDGQYDYSAFRVRDGWEETNLVEAFLEIGFSLPYHRNAYEKHDVDVVMNDVVVATLRDQIPEGNYSFRLPPTALRFNDEGVPAGNEIDIRTTHLRGGHYVVSSDFRIKTRLTGTRVWVVADSPEAAKLAVTENENLTLDGPDYSVSSADLSIHGEPAVGRTLTITAPVRNVGAVRTNAVAVALMKDLGRGDSLELGRVYIEDVPLTGTLDARVDWTASAGRHTLWFVVDPDNETGDDNRVNNKAVISVDVPGDDAEPTVTFITPSDGDESDDSVITVEVEASDDRSVGRVQLAVDSGVPVTLAPLDTADRFVGQVLLQPGRHRLRAIAVDESGNSSESVVYVAVEAPAPTVTIVSPDDGSQIDERSVVVSLSTESDVKVIAGRVNGGPWKTGRLDGERGTVELELAFGEARIEVMAVNDRGVRATDQRTVTCTKQPDDESDEDEEDDGAGTEDTAADENEEDGTGPGTADDPEPDADDGVVNIPGVGEVDVLGPPNRPLPPTGVDAPARRRPSSPASNEPGAPPSSGGSARAPASPPVGSAPATEAQPVTLPPVVDRPTVEDAPAADDEEAEPEPGAPGEPDRAGDTQPSRTAAPARRSHRPRGGFIGANARKSDWYCTNRPRVHMKFQLPDELKRKKLPKPGTPEFQAMMTRLLTDMRMRGYKMNKIEQFHKALLRRIKGMDQPGELPAFLESFNIVGPKPDDPARLKEWREHMENTANAWFLRLLSSGDPNLVAQGLKARADAIGQFDLAMQEHAEAAITEIEANQKIVETFVEALPVVGEMADVYAFVTGESALSGERLSALERCIRLAGVIGPFGLEQLVKRSPNAQLVLQAFGEMGESMGRSGKEMLAAAMGKSYKEIDDAFGAVGKFLTKERKLIGETMEDKMAREARLFAKSPEGIADATRRLQDHADARDLVNRLRNASPDSDDYARAVRELQSNKTAQALINRADVPDVLRKDVNQHIKGWYDAADAGVADGFQSLYRGTPDADEVARIADRMGITPAQAEDFQQQVASFCEKHGVKADDVVVDKLTITNRRPPKPGEVPRTSVGRDRDVTFQIQTPMRDPDTGKVLIDPLTKKPRMIGEDIHHATSKGVYERQFWEASGQGDLPRLDNGDIDANAISRYAEDTMDQTVTSAAHNEAYNTGEVLLDDFLDKGITPTITRIDDVCDTVQYKSTHWFGKADEAAAAGDAVMASRNAAEGMRQATKQYDDLVLSRVRQYGLDPNVHVPPRLQASMDVFRQVKEGAISPAKAEAMLKAIGSSKEQAVREMAGFLNGLEKTTGVGWRRIKSAELVNKVAGIQKAGGAGWQDDAFGAINNALKNGHISGSQFTKMRADVQTKVIESIRVQYPSEWKQQLRRWADQAYQRRLISAAEKARLEAQSE